VSDGTILVTFGELESARNSIQATWANISREMEDLKRSLRPLVETWTGDASSAYQAYQTEWDRSANDLNQVLNQIAVALGTSNDNYQAGEVANTRRWFSD
jgi:6 kDa early secretory antigenic target